MITPEMRRLVEDNTIGLVATVTPDGYPRVSPKGTMVVVDERTVVFADIRSPGTRANVESNPAVEMNFLDVMSRRVCRLRGRTSYHARGSARWDEFEDVFDKWAELKPRMKGLFVVTVEAASLVKSPVYDIGYEEAALRRQWLGYYTALADKPER
ncbi:MAG: pyridoxamine 5'-phosphate oxidase family protein [Hyphomicrobiaceae bacterium]